MTMRIRALLFGALLWMAISPHASSGATGAGAEFDYAYQVLSTADEAREQGDLETAIIMYDEAFRLLNKLSEEYPNWQSGVVSTRRDYCEAQRELLLKRTGLTLEALSSSGDKAKAAETNAVAATTNPTAAIRAEALAALKKGKADSARRMLERALKRNKSDVQLKLTLAVACCSAGRFDRAVELLEPLIAAGSASAEMHTMLAAAYAGRGDRAAAERQLAVAIEKDPTSAAAHYNMALLLAEGTPPQPEEAARHYAAYIVAGGMANPAFEAALASRYPGSVTNAIGVPSTVTGTVTSAPAAQPPTAAPAK